MNENILAATRGLNKAVALGRVEPLHSTFSHHVVSAGSKIDHEPPVPANRHVRRPVRYAVYAHLDSVNDMGISAENGQLGGLFSSFCRILAPNNAKRPGHTRRPGRLDRKTRGFRSIADVDRAQPVAVRRQHAAGHVAAVDGRGDIADAEAVEEQEAAAPDPADTPGM